MEGKSVVPMEITFMDNEGNIFVLDEFIEQMNSYVLESILVSDFFLGLANFLS
jgi:hypothetical protein